MEIRCRCPACAAKFKVDGKYAGKKARCPKCQAVVDVPLESADESTQSFPAIDINPSKPVASPTASGSSRSAPKKAPLAPAAPVPPLPGPGSGAIAPRPAPAEAASPLSGLNLAGPRSAPARPAQAAPSQSAVRSAAASGPASPHAPAPSKPQPSAKALPFILAGGMAVITLLALGAIALLLNWQPGEKGTAKKAPGSKSTASTKGTLHILWPASDREDAMLSVDGKFVSIDKPGELKVPVNPGWHKVHIQRGGYETISQELMVAQGQTRRFNPDWKAVSAAVLDPAAANVATNTNPTAETPTGARPVSIPGFEGWLPSLEAAKTQAAAGEQEKILLVFGAAYQQPASQQLGEVLKEAGVTETYRCVIINFEKTREGFGLSDDSPQNQKLYDAYAIDRLPVLVLADKEGRPFFIKRDWSDGLGSPRLQLPEWAKNDAKRDELLAAAKAGDDAGRLAAATKAIEWLQENDVWQFYGAEFAEWLALAQKVDPDNRQGLFETFFESQWLLNLATADKADPGAIAGVAAQLDPWFTRKFKDHDRAVKLHVIAAQMLIFAERQDDASKYMAEAITYQPQNDKLADTVRALKLALENKDVLGSGTGFFISSAGYILTNHHVIGGEGRVEVRLPGAKEMVPAEVIAQDEAKDIAILKVALAADSKVEPLPVVAQQVPRGEEVAAFGFPLTDVVGSTLKFTRGFISSDPDEINGFKYVLDLRINPGNSGGPLCDPQGRVVGMVTAKTRTTTFEDSYGMAIPSTMLVEFLDQHLPGAAPRAKPAAKPLTWTEINQHAGNSVVMIVKKR